MGKSILITDFDDTLAQTDANVIVKKSSGKTVVMDPAQYAVYDPEDGDRFDFSEFEQLINPRPIQRFVKLLKHAISGKADRAVVLTARGHTRPVAQFLKMHGITSGVAIAALGDSNPEKKARYVEKQILDGYDRVVFVDDSPKNVAAVSRLKTKYPQARLLVHRAEEHTQAKSDTPTSVATKQRPKAEPTKTKSSKLKSFIANRKITNPDTGAEILIRSALKYDKQSKVYNAAKKAITDFSSHR